MSNYQVEFFESTPGKFPVSDFINNLEPNTQSKTKRSVELLREFGPFLGPPHSKKLSGTALWELRVLGQNNLRILYVSIPNKNFLFLHGFTKKSEKTPKKEIETALNRLLQYRKIVIK